MSTAQRYGEMVWNALVALSDKPTSEVTPRYYAVGEVAELAGVSKPTAKKYLTQLINMKEALGVDTGNRRVVYRVRS